MHLRRHGWDLQLCRISLMQDSSSNIAECCLHDVHTFPCWLADCDAPFHSCLQQIVMTQLHAVCRAQAQLLGECPHMSWHDMRRQGFQ